MSNTNREQWNGSYEIAIAAAPETIWRLFTDVAGWPRWNAGIEQIAIDGPFAVGSEIEMKPPGQDPFRSRLVEVRERERFVDETRVGDLVVQVTHRIDRVAAARSRVVYELAATGPGAGEIGPAIAADFDEVLRALAAQAEA